MTDLYFHADAELDYEAPVRWYLRRSRRSAHRFANEVDRVFDAIRRNPQQYGLLDDRHRCAVLRRFSYVIIYRIEAGAVRVVAIPHSRQAARHWRGRQ
jgi:plasmid stabilization system protein ParE